MAKEKIVRCRVCREASSGGEPRAERSATSVAASGAVADGSVRYVPLEIFDLWKHLMTEKHSFSVSDETVSIWFDIDGDPNVSYSEANYEKVTRLSLLVYSERDGMYHKITRYVPSDGYAEIRPRILSHYSRYFDSPQFPPRIEEACGVWLRRADD
ncbi:MAG: hypothetical protein WAW06_05090 [bacterium]